MHSEIPSPQAFLIPDVFSKGTVSLIAARRGVGKTYTGLLLGSCIALGKPFGPLETRKGRVLYLSQEMGETQIKQRLTRLFTDEEAAELGRNIMVKCKLPWNLESKKNLKDLEVELRAAQPLFEGDPNPHPYDVVIVDTLRDVKGKLREADNDEMGQALVLFRDMICEVYGVAGIIMHHKGKPGDDGQDRGSRGASAMEDVAADVIYLDRPVKDSPTRTWTFNKTRDGAMEGKTLEITIEDDDENESKVKIGVSESVPVSDINFELKKMYSCLEQNGASLFSKEDICGLMSWSVRTAERYVKLASDAGRLVNTTRRPMKAAYRYVPLAE